jgi:glycosyltransferase involved in cell wall biosynthesis
MVGKKLSKMLKYGSLKWLGKPLYENLISLELKYVDYKSYNFTFGDTPLVDTQLTAIIKTFERPVILKRLLDSIFKFYPNMNIIVVDDSQNPTNDSRVTNITLPYDSGVSLGRQIALEAVSTPYVLLLDDDFIFYHKTVLEDALKTVIEDNRIDIMGGEVINLPSFKSNDYSIARLHPTQNKSVYPVGTILSGYKVYDKVPNFYIARSDRLKLVGWDKSIKRLDHADFFTRAKGILTTVYNPNFKVLHAQTPYNDTYMKKRDDITQDRMVLRMKYYK